MKNLFSAAILAIFFISFSAFTSNNQTTSSLPDLIITNVEVKCASQRLLVIDVKNIGTVKSDATLLRIRPKNQDDPTQRCIKQAVTNVPQLQPGNEFRLRVPLKDTNGCNCQGALQFDLMIDHKNFIIESDETNNTKELVTGV